MSALRENRTSIGDLTVGEEEGVSGYGSHLKESFKKYRPGETPVGKQGWTPWCTREHLLGLPQLSTQ